MNPTLHSAWQATHPAAHHVRTHTHSDWELVYYISGSGHTHLGETLYPFAAHTFALIPPGIPHDETHTMSGMVLCIEFLAENTINCGVYSDFSDTIGSLARRIRTEKRNALPDASAFISLKLQELLLDLNRMSAPTARPKQDLRYAMHFLDENYGRAISLRDLAAEYRYSYHYFYHRFRAVAGCAPQQYLLRTRLRAAAQLLQTTDNTCTDIALMCGFYGSAQFSALFRQAFGCTPSDYRKKYSGNMETPVLG